MLGPDSGQYRNNVVPKTVCASILPDREHDFVGKIMLYLSLQPPQQVGMALHGYSFPDNPEIPFQMLVGESGWKRE
jgi:hypothetical protein